MRSSPRAPAPIKIKYDRLVWRLLVVLVGCGRIDFDPLRDATSTDALAFPLCGDGITEVPEQCDNGSNTLNGPCPHCLIASCGDGLIELGVEQCDEGPGDSPNGACPSCHNAFCGDGFVWSIEGGNEQCDHGGMDNVCTATCTCVGGPPC